MLSRLATYTLFGIEARPVEVEVDISPGAIPKVILVGLAEAAVKESIHRIAFLIFMYKAIMSRIKRLNAFEKFQIVYDDYNYFKCEFIRKLIRLANLFCTDFLKLLMFFSF